VPLGSWSAEAAATRRGIAPVRNPGHAGAATADLSRSAIGIRCAGVVRVYFVGERLIRQPEAGQRHAGEADAEFLQRCAARDGLGQALGEFIELVVHTFPFF